MLRRAGDWLEARTGVLSFAKRVLEERIPGGASFWYVFGSVLVGLMAAQILSGLFLAMYYAPTVAGATPSLEYLQKEVALGGFALALHKWGATAVVVALVLHAGQTFLFGAYRKPRELNWLVGAGLLLVVLALAFTGSLLPWDQRSYWATSVGLSVAGMVPVIGPLQRLALQGGPEIGALTLTRFYALHAVALPLLLLALLGLHLFLFLRHKVTPRWDVEEDAPGEPFYPGQWAKDAAAIGLALLLVAALACHWPRELEEAANPAVLYEPRPEWYFLFLFQLLKLYKAPVEVLGTTVIPAALVAALAGVPFLDRSPDRSPSSRRRLLSAGAGLLTALAALTVGAVVSDAAARPGKARALFLTQCSSCHGEDGKGKLEEAKLPDFSDPAWQRKKDDAALVRTIHDGKKGDAASMPAFGDRLSRQQMLLAVEYIRSLGRGER